DTERAVEILSRYQSTLQTPEEQELKASIGKVSHIFRSELFHALLDIHEFYDFTLRSAPLQPAGPGTQHGTAGEQHEASQNHSAPREPQHLPQDPSQHDERSLPRGAGDSGSGTPPRLVRVTARRTEAPASICSLVLSSHSTLPQVSL
ncbi:DLG1 protein, partial [Psilopogon haemacephalus]|nr:DLG1 protein [Psilopogon haemacephalus]